MNFNYKSVFFCKADANKNFGNILDYLLLRTEHLVTFFYSLGFSNELSYMRIYEKGEMIYEKKFKLYRGKNNKIRYIVYWLYFNYIALRYCFRGTSVILDTPPIFLILNFLFSKFRSFKYVFWLSDYFPNRKFPMILYHLLVEFYNKHLKYVIYMSPPVENIYFKNGQIVKNKYRALVTLGFKKRFAGRRLLKKSPLILGFIGVVKKQQGLELAFKYLKANPDIVFEIVGNGYDLAHYKRLVKKMGISKNVKFYGYVEDVSVIFKNWSIALALYENTSSNVAVYCEPTKIKTYLSYGIPVVITDATYFHKEILKFKAGEVVKENVKSLADAIQKITNNYGLYIHGVDKIADKYEYVKWYDEKFKFLREN